MLNVVKILNYDNLGSCHLLPRNVSHYSTRGHNKKLLKGRYKCHLRKYSFSFRVTNTWNSLSNKTINAETTNEFKKFLDDELHS